MDTGILLGILRGSHTISTVSQCLRHFAPLPWCVLTSTTKSFSTELLANSRSIGGGVTAQCCRLLNLCVCLYTDVCV